jgi:flagellin-like hook-associated protein FlgL
VRITQRAVGLTSLQGLNRNLDAVSKLQQQLTSGRVISAPSDSPTGTNKAMQTRSDQAATAQQARNITDAKGWIEQGDSTLREMLDTSRRVRDLTVQGLNSGASTDASRQALATEVSSLQEGLLGLANTSIQGRPLFGGLTAGNKAYNPDGTWAGQAGSPVTRKVSGSEMVRVDVTGPEAFGPDSSNLFTVVSDIATALNATPQDPVALAGHLDALDAAMQKMTTAVADLGARGARVERAENMNADMSLSLQERLGLTENIDLPNTIMKLQMQQTGYEAALAATAKAISPTLMDYLR